MLLAVSFYCDVKRAISRIPACALDKNEKHRKERFSV